LDAIEHCAKGDQTKAESLSNIAAKMKSKGQENLEKEQHSGAVFVPYFSFERPL
jgi:hypothetical protein